MQKERTRLETIRLCITVLVVSLYSGWALLGLIMFLYAGNSLLLLILPGLAYPLRRVVDYYFAVKREL
jgi:hypothetical protein